MCNILLEHWMPQCIRTADQDGLDSDLTIECG